MYSKTYDYMFRMLLPLAWMHGGTSTWTRGKNPAVSMKAGDGTTRRRPR